MKKIIISVTTDLVTDQRIHKVANSLQSNGFQVLVVGRSLNHSKSLSLREYQCYRFELIFNKGFLFYCEFNLRLFFFLLFANADFLLSNDLDTLLPNFIVSKLKNKTLIYDSHELFTEVPELNNRFFVKKIWLLIERICLPRLKKAYTVSNSIAAYYNKQYGMRMSVVRNLPLMKEVRKKKHNTIKKIIYQGAVNKDRGIDLMISSMQYINAELCIIGSGDILDEMIKYTNDLQLQKKVIFLGQMHFEELFDITQNADLGLSFEADSCLAYRYSLPNKIFDYINAEIPILISDLPEFNNIIDKYNIGMVLESRRPEDIARQINKLLTIKKSMWLPQILLAKKEFCWRLEERKLLSVFS